MTNQINLNYVGPKCNKVTPVADEVKMDIQKEYKDWVKRNIKTDAHQEYLEDKSWDNIGTCLAAYLEDVNGEYMVLFAKNKCGYVQYMVNTKEAPVPEMVKYKYFKELEAMQWEFEYPDSLMTILKEKL